MEPGRQVSGVLLINAVLLVIKMIHNDLHEVVFDLNCTTRVELGHPSDISLRFFRPEDCKGYAVECC